MTAKSFIVKRLNQLSDRFGKERFSYGYRSVSNTHVIEVLPLSFFQNNKEYLEEEYLLETDFYEKFPEEEILFVSSDSLIQLDCPEQTFGSLLFFVNAPAIVFPYVRAYLSTLTNLSGLRPLNLPTLNLTTLKDKLKQNTRDRT